MTLTITVSDELAQKLEAQAGSQRKSVEDWVLTILGHAVENPDELPTWSNLNKRRFELIEKKYTVGLDKSEEQEFHRLQDAVAKLLEPHDRQMLDLLNSYQGHARRTPE
jgi:hypothetical protein